MTKGRGEHSAPPADLGPEDPCPLAPVTSETSENLLSVGKVPETAAVAWHGHMYLTDILYLLR